MVVVSAHINVVFIGQLYQVLAALLQQLAVGGVGYGLGHHVVFTMILSVLLALSTPPLRAASMGIINKVSTRSLPMRFLQRLKLEGSMGQRFCK
jgi:hypothetical protein